MAERVHVHECRQKADTATKGAIAGRTATGTVKAAWGTGQTAHVEDSSDLCPSPAPSPRHHPLRLLPSGQGQG